VPSDAPAVRRRSVEVWLCTGLASITRAPARRPMYSSALARMTAPSFRSTARDASPGSAAASPVPAVYIVVATVTLR
jgi:hypothetical protein